MRGEVCVWGGMQGRLRAGAEEVVSREAELAERLAALADVLAEEAEGAGLPAEELPEEAPWRWTEAQVRAFFREGSAPAAAASTEPRVSHEFVPRFSIVSDVQAPSSSPAPPKPEALERAQKNTTVRLYAAAALQSGIPPRVCSLFEANDPLLERLENDRTLLPFQKHLLDGSGENVLVLQSWAAGESAAQHGLDMRTFLHGPTAELGTGNRLTAAVRFGKGASIGAGHWLSAHGGAISTALDEATAELVKITHAPLATTAEISYQLKRPVELNVTHRIECEVLEVRGGGLKISVKGELFDPDDHLCASCTAVLANLQMLRK